MVEIGSTVLIITSSALLFGYWFRYTCLLILSAKTAHDYAAEVASANQLCFPRVLSKLREHNVETLGCLHRCLDRDYAIIARLLEHIKPSSRQGGLERLILAIDYRMMNVWYGVSLYFSIETASHALQEMALVVAYLANELGERA